MYELLIESVVTSWVVNSGSESDRESNSLTGEGWGLWAWKGRLKKAIGRAWWGRAREGELCISSGKSVENKTLFLEGFNAAVLNYKGVRVNHLWTLLFFIFLFCGDVQTLPKVFFFFFSQQKQLICMVMEYRSGCKDSLTQFETIQSCMQKQNCHSWE